MSNNCCHSPDDKKIPFIVEHKTVILSAVLILLWGLSFQIEALQSFAMHLQMYVFQVWWAIALGFLIAGAIDYYIPREYMTKLFATGQKRSIPVAVLTGFIMSACSHGILAIGMQLYKKGASTSSVIAFLLASPWANLPFTLLMFGFFGVPKTIFIISAAIVIAFVTGFIYLFLEKNGLIEANVQSEFQDKNFSIKKDLAKRFNEYQWNFSQLKQDIIGVVKGAQSLSKMILWWLLLGIGLAGVIGAYIPENIFHTYFGPDIPGLLVTLAGATVIEVCSEGSIPIAFEVYRNTGAIGNALVFLMAGVATDYTEIGLIWQNIGKKAAIYLPIITVPQIILWGLLANHLF